MGHKRNLRVCFHFLSQEGYWITIYCISRVGKDVLQSLCPEPAVQTRQPHQHLIPAGAWAKWEMPAHLQPPKSQPIKAILISGFSRLHGFLEDPIALCFVRKISGKLELPPGKWLAPTDTCLSTQVPRGAIHPWSIPGAPLHPGVPFEDIAAYETNLP